MNTFTIWRLQYLAIPFAKVYKMKTMERDNIFYFDIFEPPLRSHVIEPIVLFLRMHNTFWQYFSDNFWRGFLHCTFLRITLWEKQMFNIFLRRFVDNIFLTISPWYYIFEVFFWQYFFENICWEHLFNKCESVHWGETWPSCDRF